MEKIDTISSDFLFLERFFRAGPERRNWSAKMNYFQLQLRQNISSALTLYSPYNSWWLLKLSLCIVLEQMSETQVLWKALL